MVYGIHPCNQIRAGKVQAGTLCLIYSAAYCSWWKFYHGVTTKVLRCCISVTLHDHTAKGGIMSIASNQLNCSRSVFVSTAVHCIKVETKRKLQSWVVDCPASSFVFVCIRIVELSGVCMKIGEWQTGREASQRALSTALHPGFTALQFSIALQHSSLQCTVAHLHIALGCNDVRCLAMW